MGALHSWQLLLREAFRFCESDDHDRLCLVIEQWLQSFNLLRLGNGKPGFSQMGLDLFRAAHTSEG